MSAAGRSITRASCSATTPFSRVVSWPGAHAGGRVTGGAEATPVEHAASGSNGPLTRRQHEVAVLIARGMTNRQIAEQLVVSPHTIERHVENILDKLRLSSRIEIAVWMVRHERG